ncbi:MAG: hypothetical protein LBU32_29935 [Clostridiales bacterium]|jgi:hypothetical protein|nr:hypothetical protein [Clostridiales bacterium]
MNTIMVVMILKKDIAVVKRETEYPFLLTGERCRTMTEKICEAKAGCGEGVSLSAFQREKERDQSPARLDAPAGLKLYATATRCPGFI